MSSLIEEVQASIHHWPWSVEVNDESINLTEKNKVNFPFYGSPVVSLSERASLFIPSRMERFSPLGCPYDSKYQIYETPHGVLAGDNKTNQIKARITRETFNLSLNSTGAVERYLDPKSKSDSQMSWTVLMWSRVFDDLMDLAFTKSGSYSEVFWRQVLDYLSQIAEEGRKPRMAVIARIAENMKLKLPLAVSTARKILLRRRNLAPLDRIQEMDVGCLQWYVRQPGETLAQKAGDKQRLLAVVRKENFNTLENQILKDFSIRCKWEASRYLQSEVKNAERSSRAISVQNYKRICGLALQEPFFEDVTRPAPGLNPNYVLQNDMRYREVWFWYRKLIKQQHEEDSLWDWQPRTWADIARLLVSTSLELLHQEKQGNSRFVVESLVESPVQIRIEQERGSRIRSQSLPGPFLITEQVKDASACRTVIEIIHPDLALQHPIACELGRLGAHLLLVANPVDGEDRKKKILAVWCVNTAATNQKINFDDIFYSARKALDEHSTILRKRRPTFPILKSLIMANSLNSQNTMKQTDDLSLIEIDADPRGWRSVLPRLGNAALSLLFKGKN